MTAQEFLPHTVITNEMKAEAERLWPQIDLSKTNFVAVTKMQGVYPNHPPRPFSEGQDARVVVSYDCSLQQGSKLIACYIPPGIPGLADICFVYFP